MPIKLIIFDMDGVLIDSESKYDLAIERLIGQLRVKLPEDRRLQLMGAGVSDNARKLKDWYSGLPYSEVEIAALYERALRLVLQNEVDSLVDGVSEFIAYLRGVGMKTALASSSSRAMVAVIANRFKLDRVMAAILTGDDIEHSKPDPEIFLKAAKTLDVLPSECLVIEDSKNGIAAGKAAGMHVAAFLGAQSRFPVDISAADFAFSRFDGEDIRRHIGELSVPG